MMEFILERYNYLIVILLMMTGLYIVFSRGNLVKTIIGLNLFQTSVFIFYITIGKVAGGTAPILVGGYGGGHGDDHGNGHGGDHGAGYGDDAGHAGETAQSVNDLAPLNLSAEDAATLQEYSHNDLDGAIASAGDELQQREDSLHAAPVGEGVPDTANSLLDDTDNTAGTPNGTDPDLHTLPDAPDGYSAAQDVSHGADQAVDHAADGLGYAASAGDVIYSNPLPHVLILTAIVVGVATTAVGLALAVRIREAYGSIEEDELEAADYEAEFGKSIDTASPQNAGSTA